jgi:hypothetical protein
MEFKKIFKKSWGEYTKNIKEIFLIVLLLIIPLGIVNYLFDGLSTIYKENLLILTIFLITIFLYFAFQTLFASSIIYFSLFEKRIINYKKTIKGGLKYFGKYLGFVIVGGIFILLLSLLLIIPGIIFGIYWCLAPYILFKENKGIIESLKKSKKLIEGKWWNIFGYSILLGLMLMIIVGIALGIHTLTSNGLFVGKSNIPAISFVIYALIEGITWGLYSLTTIPVLVLFFKNVYLELKGKK